MWKEGGDRLLFGQYDDSAAGPNLDAEVMPVEHPHTYEEVMPVEHPHTYEEEVMPVEHPHTYERDGVGGVGVHHTLYHSALHRGRPPK